MVLLALVFLFFGVVPVSLYFVGWAVSRLTQKKLVPIAAPTRAVDRAVKATS